MVSLLAPGMNVWVPCPTKVWRAAEILEVTPKGIKIDVDGKDELIATSTNVMLRNHEEIGDEGVISLDDLTQLPHLHEPSILHALNLRYDLDTIYTSTGPILIAVNPFKQIAGLYDEKKLNGYLDQVRALGTYSMPPHVFGIAANAFIGMIKTQVGQMVLISGESGSGKTENTKFVLRLLTNMGNSGQGLSNIENLVLESNPVMESFGNSCTLRNPNSSRFGKFIELKYAAQKEGGNYSLIGASVSTYLLEKVRVTEQAEGERNYHIFYQYCAALELADADGVYTFPRSGTLTEFKKAKEKQTKRATENLAQGQKEKTELKLIPVGKTSDYHFTNQSSKRVLKNTDDAKEFEDTIFSMMVCGIDADEQQSIFRLVGAILLLGNAELKEGPPPERRSEIVASNEFVACAEALGLTVAKLTAALTWRTIITPQDRLRTPLKLADAIENRDSLARFLYDAVFQRLRDRVNTSFGGDVPGKTYSIGVLDIFGFECFEKNSFEQLCINFTNERLQQFFNTFVFKLEEALYQREQIPWEALDFPDNQDIITLISGKMGIFALLNEECRMPKGSDATFVSKLVREHQGSTRFASVKLKPGSFQINHFAGKVQYNGDNFLAKNKDQMSVDLIDCVTASANAYNQKLTTEFLADEMAPAGQSGPGGRSKPAGKLTVAASFKSQLDGLIQKVDLSAPHFIRCLKPNFHCVPDEFDPVSAVEQLRYGGVLEVLKVQRAGYPVRLAHKECHDTYRALCLLPRAKNLSADSMRESVGSMLQKIDDKYKLPRTKAGLSFTVGKTLAFFKHETYVILERLLYDYRSTYATKIARVFRGWNARKRFLKMKVGSRLIQRCVRGMLGRTIARKARKVRDADLERILRDVQARKKLEEEEQARKLELEKKRQMEEEKRRAAAEEIRMAEELKRREVEDALRRQKEQESKQVELLALRQEKLDMLAKLNDFEAKVVNQNNEYNKKLEEERGQKQREMEQQMLKTSNQFEEEKTRLTREREVEVQRLEAEAKERERQREQELLEHQLKLRKELETRESQAKQEMQILQEKQKNESGKFTQDMQRAQMEFERAMEEKSRDAAQMQSASQRLEQEISILNEKCDAYRARLAAQEHDFLKQLNQQEMHSKEESDLRAEAQAARARDLQNEITAKTAAHKKQMEQQKESYTNQLELQRKTLDDQRKFLEMQAAEKSQQYEAQLKNSSMMFEQEIKHKQQMFQRLKQENEDQRAAFDEKLQEHLNRIQELTEQTTDMSSATHQMNFFKDQVSYAEKRRNSLQGKLADKDFEVTNLKFKNSRMNVNSVTQFTLGAAAAMKWSMSRKDFDIVVAGGPKCGKSHLLSALLTSHGAPAYVPDKDAPVKLLELPLAKSGSRDGQKKMVKILECSSDAEHFPLVVSHFSKSHWVICVYDACDTDSIDMAFVLAEQAKRESTVLLFGNMYRSKQGEPLAVDIETIRERARESFFLALEGDDLGVTANMVFKIMEGEKRESNSAHDSGAAKGKSITKSMALRPSTVSAKEGIFRAHVINQWDGKRNAVTSIVMGKENANKAYFLMAAGYREGHLAVFRVFRTAMELEMLDPEAYDGMAGDNKSTKPKEMLCWHAHDRAVTSMMFTPFEDQIVSSSTDLSIRFWNVSNGNLLQVFEDSYPISCVICLPKHPYVFISGNANGILRVGDTEQGVVLQKLKAPVEVRAIVVDSTGLFVFCGTRRGLLLGLECDTPSTMKFLKNLRLQLSQKGIGKITFVPKRANTKPMLLVNSSDSYVSVVELHYNDANHCTNMQVLRRFRNVNNLLPLSSCFVEDASDENQEKGFVVSASEDKKIYVWNMHGIAGNQKLEHPSATIDVAVNKMGTVIASGDAVGNIFLWRRACRD
eukprot:GEMP01000332.1.p1 GENE.GEMP01000332.1~~GEMP01000332.1.p1  ORF type:complete len:1868 (+),score=475.57 GEMP01000332.1:93-5696(+)